MDKETTDRFDRYFELIQQQLQQMQGQLTTMQGQITAMQGQITAMQGQIADVQAEQKALRTEMNERFLTVDGHIRTLGLRMQLFESRVDSELIAIRQHVAQLDGRVERLDERMKVMETTLVGFSGRLETFGEDMHQRFRVVSERLATMEKRNAA